MVSSPPALRLPDTFTLADMTVEHGYTFYATSQLWKRICRWLPCMIWLDWPGYSSAFKEVQIGDQVYFVQCWKGWCGDLFQHFPLPKAARKFRFPGGVGAEVGIYCRTNPWVQPRPPAQEEDFLFNRFHPPEWVPSVTRALGTWWTRRKEHAGQRDAFKWWWADVAAVPDSGPGVTFSLFDRLTGDPLIEGYNTHSYWTCKWMKTSDFRKWRRSHSPGRRATRKQLNAKPSDNADEYVLRFEFAGTRYVWDTDATIDLDFTPSGRPSTSQSGPVLTSARGRLRAARV